MRQNNNYMFNVLFSIMGGILLSIAGWIGLSVAHLPAIEQRLDDYIISTTDKLRSLESRMDKFDYNPMKGDKI